MRQFLVPGLLWFSVIGCGLLAGVYFAFSAFVMTALGRIDQSAGITVFNSVNAVIVRSLFMPVFLGSTLSAAALAVLEETENIDLVLTDVVLPGGMDGRELAEEIKQRRPNVNVLFMSGYTDSAIVHEGVLERDTTLLRKPFRKLEMARTVKDAVSN